ncbi:hypothetical protein [Mycobacterium sp.]|uniref:hypothetical protein n=1 Tax=Mycobacterium sp. TaxID=1785 RepID=UPI0012794861|nr:hypothetical protein [Mycobacterium sp.]KAA8969124.1 MAG: hypothetical protein F6Q13_03985 [Mycobacterium sp.]
MWCPSATLSVWAGAWLAGKAAPDDVLDALSLWAPTQSVTAYDAVAAGHAGLPWPDVHDVGAVWLLQTLRSAAGRGIQPALAAAAVNLVLPVPGDVRGLIAGTQFERDALAAGEAVIVSGPDDAATAVGLVPEFRHGDTEDAAGMPAVCALSWTVYSLPALPALDQHELAETEYQLRLAVRSAADALTAIGPGTTGVDVDDPRGRVEQLLEMTRRHRVPEHAPSRAVRVLETAARVDAIITVGTGSTHIAVDTLRPLAQVVRSARIAAVSAILRSAWLG